MANLFHRIFIANRGEAAVRVARGCDALSIVPVFAVSDADADAAYVKGRETVRLGPSRSQQSYLDMDRVVQAAKQSGCTAVHPGWGFLSENPRFASLCAHHGLTFILVPLNLPGITVRPIPQLDGLPGFAEIFFDNVKVPVERRLGKEGEGWQVAMATAGFERGLMLRSPARFQNTARRLVELYKANRESADRDPTVRDAVTRAYLDAEAYTLTTYQTACRLNKGGKIGPESSTNKIFWSELDQRMHETAMSILSARAELLPHAPAAAGVGTWLDGFLFAQSGPIYAGTNEIQRNIIAERMLGMPR